MMSRSWLSCFVVLTSWTLFATTKSLWSSAPATFGSSNNDDYLLKTGYLIGNGKLGGLDRIPLPFEPGCKEIDVLVSDTIWASRCGDTRVEFGLVVVWRAFPINSKLDFVT